MGCICLKKEKTIIKPQDVTGRLNLDPRTEAKLIELPVEPNPQEDTRVLRRQGDDRRRHVLNQISTKIRNKKKRKKPEQRHSFYSENSKSMISGGKLDYVPYLQGKHDPNFNFKLFNKRIYTGIGMKRLRAYVSTISIEEIVKKREEFWSFALNSL